MQFIANAFIWLAKSSVGQFVIHMVFGKLVDALKKMHEDKKKKEQIKKDVAASVKPLVDAKTPEEIDRATKQALDDF
jgi:hypothetical protein